MQPVTVTWSPEARGVCVLGAAVCVLGDDGRWGCWSGGEAVCDCAVTGGCAVINANATVPTTLNPAENFLDITGFSFRGVCNAAHVCKRHTYEKLWGSRVRGRLFDRSVVRALGRGDFSALTALDRGPDRRGARQDPR